MRVGGRSALKLVYPGTRRTCKPTGSRIAPWRRFEFELHKRDTVLRTVELNGREPSYSVQRRYKAA